MSHASETPGTASVACPELPRPSDDWLRARRASERGSRQDKSAKTTAKAQNATARGISEAAAQSAAELPCWGIGLEGMVNSIFDDADTNDDGLVDISESYILILRLYIKVNQKAPIKPPSRETADMLFNTADTDVSGMINKQEFLQLSLELFASAGIRVLAYKLVSFLLAPLLATYLSGWLVTHPNNLTESAVAAARAVVPDSLESSVFTQGTLTTILIVVFVSTLGHVFMDLVDTLLLRVGKAENEEAATEAKRKDSLL